MTQPESENGKQTVRETQVWWVQGKKANKDFRSALSFHRENATLSETGSNEKADPEHDVYEEEGHHVDGITSQLRRHSHTPAIADSREANGRRRCHNDVCLDSDSPPAGRCLNGRPEERRGCTVRNDMLHAGSFRIR